MILFTGDIHGYLEPCGCTEGQSGGFALRGDLLRQLREEKKWPTTALDVGGTLNDSRVTYPQTLIKFSIILKGLNELGYQGLALGKEELLLGAQQLFTEFTNVSSQPGFHVPFLGSNVTIFGSKELGTPSDTRIIEVGGLKIGVAAVTGMSTRSALENAGVLRDPNELQVQDPRTVLPGMLEKLKAEKPDLLVLLSASDMQESQALAKEFPDFNIVVTSESAEDPRPDPVYIDKTLLVQVGKKGKNAAVVGILPDGKLESTVIELKVDRFKDLPEMVDLMREYQERLKADWPALSAQSISDPKTGSFMGAESCKKCHTYAYSVWSNTKHAHAYESLAKGRPSEAEHWISRIYDPECLACHTTGWDPQKALRHASGFTDMQKTPLLAGQQCENCHGAGSKHVAAEEGWKPGAPVTPEQAAEREALRLTLSRAKTDVCLKCHDGDNSPHFDFDKYWPKVNHSGRKN
ncbi:multiheme c-type cytochrome [Planctomicrobium piriforme]|uniref:multiheme c-type cytochrome n=1 Tax=Planctomicrobium piriforme TaxID=1576369 RepID=UPI0015875E9B|nr:multiheme c-type cytochrome [Planctomicrobium piriforme]